MRKPEKVLRSAVVAAVVLLVLLGCGAETSRSESSGKHVKGGTLEATLSQDPPSLDPALAYDNTSWSFVHAVFTTLVTYEKKGLGLAPWAATAVPEPQDGGKRYVFDLHPGMEFSNGEPLDAAAYKYSIERVLDPTTKSPLAGYYTNIAGAEEFAEDPKRGLTGIEILSPTKLEFNLEEPDKAFLNTMALPSASAVPRKAVEEAGADFASRPVGSGQFVLDEYQPGSKLVLTKNPNYFDKRTAARLDRLNFTLGMDPHTGLLRVQQGQSQFLGDLIPSADFNRVKNDPRFEDYIHHATGNAITYFYMNTGVEPWSSRTVREAVHHAIDKERIVQVSNNGRGQVANQMLPPGMPGHEPGIEETPHDPERARELLEQAGYPDGFGMTFWSDNSPDSVKAAQVIQQDLGRVGIDAEIRSASFEEYLNATSTGETDAGMAGWFADFPDPSTFLNVLFDSGQIPATNLSGYSNPQVDERLARARYVQDTEEHLALYQEIQRQILGDYPVVPIFYHVNYFFVSPRIEGYSIHPVWGGWTYADWYVTK